jgi:hypothetical protein
VQTITVSRVSGLQVNTAKFLERARNVRIKGPANQEKGSSEEYSVVTAERLETQHPRLRGLATAIFRHTYPMVDSRFVIQDGRITPLENDEVRSDFARVWVGHEGYILFCFLGGFPRASIYSLHRLLAARCLTTEQVTESQNLVQTVGYDLTCVRSRFPHNIWDQNFQRKDAISRGRIRGTAMETDPLYSEFSHIGSDIGVEIPITGSSQKVQVIQDGRVKFMALQLETMEAPETRDTALDSIIQVLKRLKACETR